MNIFFKLFFFEKNVSMTFILVPMYYIIKILPYTQYVGQSGPN